MAGVQIEADLSGLKTLNQRIARLGKVDKRKLLNALGAEMESQTRRRLAEEKESPEGEPWKAWSPKHAQTRHGGQGLLLGEGALLDSITFAVPNDGAVLVGSNLVYAAILQFGGAEVGKPGLPARPYLGLSAANRRGWWGGCSGSGIWQHTRAKNTQANALALADEARQALAWLTKDGLATSLEVEAVRQAGQIALQVRVKGVASAFKGGLYAV